MGKNKKRRITATKKAGHVEPPPPSSVVSEETDGGIDEDGDESYKALPDDKLEEILGRLEQHLELLGPRLPENGKRLRDRLQLLGEEKKRRTRAKTIADECDQSEENGDNLVIDGYTFAAGSGLILISLPGAVGERSIHLQVHCENRKNFNYLIGRNSPLENLMFDYAGCILMPRDYITFVFDQRPIDLKKTADDLQLVDGDIVTAKVRMPYENY